MKISFFIISDEEDKERKKKRHTHTWVWYSCTYMLKDHVLRR